jgi:HEAT repeat protein
MEPASEHESFDGTLPIEALADLVLRKEQYALRSQAMRALANRTREEPQFVGLLAEALRDAEPSIRRRAAHTLGCVGSAAQSVLGQLCQAMRSDPIWTVRAAAVQAVSAISWPAREDYRSADVPLRLVDVALEDREPLVRDAAINGLAACMADERVLGVCVQIEDQLSNTMRHPHASRRCRAITAVCRLSQDIKWGTGAIWRGLIDSHWKVRRSTVQAFGENPAIARWLHPGYYLPVLARRLFDHHPMVQAAACEALDRLLVACQDQAVAKLLASLTGKPSAVETLLATLHDFKLSPLQELRFQDLCLRRVDWHLQHISDPPPRSSDDAPGGMVCQLLSMAAMWQVSARRLARDLASAKQSAEEKEASWLLARWLEIYFGASVVESTDE